MQRLFDFTPQQISVDMKENTRKSRKHMENTWFLGHVNVFFLLVSFTEEFAIVCNGGLFSFTLLNRCPFELHHTDGNR